MTNHHEGRRTPTRMQIVVRNGIDRTVATDNPLFWTWAERTYDWPIPQVTIHNVVLNKKDIPIIIQMSALCGGVEYAFTLRGASVDLLTVLVCDGERYLAHVTQPRIAIGCSLTSNVAGFIDIGESPEEAALRERGEELAKLPHGTLIDLNRSTLHSHATMFVSAGGDDEEVYFFAEERTITPDELNELNGKVSGLAHEGEKTTVGITRFDESVLEVLPMLAEGKPGFDVKFVLSAFMYDFHLNGGHER